MTPFELVYEKKPPSVLLYMLGISKVQEVEKTLKVHASILRALKDNLVMAQNFMKQQAYQGHLKFQFAEGDHVFIRLQPYK
jgi:surfactin synthase thioesterase subunit